MKSLSDQSHYEVLELAPGATGEAIGRAYAKAKETYSPGSLATYALVEPGEAEAVLKRVEEAFAILSDLERRKAYDAQHGWAPAPTAVPEPSAKTEVPSTPPTAPSDAPAEVQASEPTQPPGVPMPAAPVVPVETKSESKPDPEIKPETRPETRPDSKPEARSDSRPEVTEPGVPRLHSPPPSPSSPTDPSGFGPGIAPHASASDGASDLKPSPSSLSPPPPSPTSFVDKPVRKTEAELPPDAPVTGEALKRVREARGLSLKDLEAKTKIGHWHLEAIEREKYAGLPAQVYLRGFLMSLARELKLDPVRVSKSYLEQMKVKQAEKVEKP